MIVRSRKNPSTTNNNQKSPRTVSQLTKEENESIQHFSKELIMQLSVSNFSGAFLLTPSHDLSLDKAANICDKLNFRGSFSLTKTATGILFKFSEPEDFQQVFRKGFHKVNAENMQNTHTIFYLNFSSTERYGSFTEKFVFLRFHVGIVTNHNIYVTVLSNCLRKFFSDWIEDVSYDIYERKLISAGTSYLWIQREQW